MSEGLFGKCCCAPSEPPEDGWLRKQVRWPWPGFTAHDFDIETDILTTKYLRQVERITITSVDFNGGVTDPALAQYTFTCDGGEPQALAPFAAYQETERWFVPEKYWMDSNHEYTVREGWVPDLLARGREGAPEDDLAYESTVSECGTRTDVSVTAIMEAPEDYIWPYADLLCDDAEGEHSQTWAAHLYQEAISGWPGWVGSLVSSVITEGGTVLTETYANGSRVVTLSEEYSVEDAFADGQEMLDGFDFGDVPVAVYGWTPGGLDDFTWGTDTEGGDYGDLTVEPGAFCTGETVDQAYRAYSYPLAAGDVGRYYDWHAVYITECYLFGTGSHCLTGEEMTPEIGVATFSFDALTPETLTAPRAVDWSETGVPYGYGYIVPGACP